MSLTVNQKGSSAQNPDLDWSQVRETINMITLAVAQIECTMKDGEKAISELSESFTFMAMQLQGLIEKGQSLENAQNQPGAELIGEIKENAQDIQGKVNNAIVAFQFYDRLTQRLDHAKRDLSWLGNLIGDSAQLYNPLAWKKLQDDIASNYSMDEERIMFEQIMNGATVEEALEIYRHHFSKENNDEDETGDEIELF
jgi:hypothetical protein